MIKLIDRYLIKSFLLPLFYCLAAFIILFIAYDMSDRLKDFFDNSIPPAVVMKYYIYQVPIILSLTVPFAILLALLYCLGNASRNNEIIAMRTSGIALFRIIRPFLVIGILLYATTFTLSEVFVPKARQLASKIVETPSSIQNALKKSGSSTATVFINIQDYRLWYIEKLDIISNTVEKIKITEFTHSGKKRIKRTIEAKSGEFVDGFGWWLYDVTTIRFYPDGSPYPAKKIRKKSFPYYTETPRDIASAKHGNPEMMNIIDIFRTMQHINEDSDYYKKLRMNVVQRFATPAACFVFILLAAPFGIFHTRAGMIKGVITSILLCLGYYLIEALFINLGDKGYMNPFLAAWTPVVIFTSVGFYLLYRMR